MQIPGSDSAWGNRLARLLVVAQFTLIGWLALLAAPAFLKASAPPWAWTLVGAGAALGLWAVSANRPTNFNIRPTPHPTGHLVEHGPYRWIRHPMYTSVGIIAAGCVGASHTLEALAIAVALAAVLVVKAQVEEVWMAQSHPDYSAYQQRTRRFLPGLF